MSDVETDMNEHTVSVSFDDADTSIDDIVEALGKAGYTVSSYAPET